MNGSVEEYRNMVLAEIKAIQGIFFFVCVFIQTAHFCTAIINPNKIH